MLRTGEDTQRIPSPHHPFRRTWLRMFQPHIRERCIECMFRVRTYNTRSHTLSRTAHLPSRYTRPPPLPQEMNRTARNTHPCPQCTPPNKIQENTPTPSRERNHRLHCAGSIRRRIRIRTPESSLRVRLQAARIRGRWCRPNQSTRMNGIQDCTPTHCTGYRECRSRDETHWNMHIRIPCSTRTPRQPVR
jgi:hypothetical protein